MKSKSYTSTVAILICLLLLAGCGGGAQPAPSPAQESVAPSPAQESAAPSPAQQESPAADHAKAYFGDFETTDLDGNAFTQEVFANADLTVLNIWATWCPPCVKEMPDLGKVAKEYADQGVQIVGICTDTVDETLAPDEDAISYAKEVIELMEANYLHLIPSMSLIKIKLADVMSIPVTLFIDKDGNVLQEIVGGRSKGEFERLIKHHLGGDNA